MTALIFISVLLTMTASSYLSVACFCIIHRMNRDTPWSLALPILTIAALGAYGFLESVAYLAGAVSYITPVVTIATVIAALLLLALPRIDTSGHGGRYGIF